MSWELKSLDQLGHVSRGRSRHRPRDAAHLYGGAYPFIQTSDVKHAGLYLTEHSQTYSEEGLAQSRLWESGTLCITIAANIADTAILGIDACFPDSVIGFIPEKDKSDARFVKYLFDIHLQRRYKKFTQGAAQDNLSQGKLLSLKFPVPGIHEQRVIADKLSAYDDLIENNRRRIQLLEQAARLLYKEWFVHLRFPGHEHATIADGVPEGWEKKPLSEIADITMGQSPKSIYYNEDGNGLPFHQGVTNFGVRFPSHQTFCTVQNRLAEPDDILFSVRAPVGRINITIDKIVIGRGLSAIRSKLCQQNLLFYALKSHFFKEDMMGGGAIFAAITKKDLHGVELMQAPDRIADMFMEHVRPIDLQIENLQQIIDDLTQARDLLLPRLMNGEVAV
ncbi:MAG: restriction endonuclease subunit S [Euryarchaeota archaeon]|nr:MAG: Type-1 restriction enzyme MjaXIP specificity protein [ANME-2 cluster archaeon]MEA1863740.1 restriction endonuclease subunit S [Euryarchaeota archaeon]